MLDFITIYIMVFVIGVFTGISIVSYIFRTKDRQIERKFSNKISCSYADEYYCLDNIECCKKPQFCEWAVNKE